MAVEKRRTVGDESLLKKSVGSELRNSDELIGESEADGTTQKKDGSSSM